MKIISFHLSKTGRRLLSALNFEVQSRSSSVCPGIGFQCRFHVKSRHFPQRLLNRRTEADRTRKLILPSEFTPKIQPPRIHCEYKKWLSPKAWALRSFRSRRKMFRQSHWSSMIERFTIYVWQSLHGDVGTSEDHTKFIWTWRPYEAHIMNMKNEMCSSNRFPTGDYNVSSNLSPERFAAS